MSSEAGSRDLSSSSNTTGDTPSTGKDLEASGSKMPEKDIYDRFPARTKNMATYIVSFASLLSPFGSSAFLPSVPQISEQLNVPENVVDLSVAVYLVFMGLAPLLWAPYSSLYGRRIIYLVSLPVFIGGSVGAALSQSFGVLIGFRILQAIGSSSVLAVGAGTIADIYRPQERGRAMGIFYSGLLLGPSIAPVLAGILTQYATGPDGGWRSVQWLLAGLGAVALGVSMLLPETIHVKGIDRVISARREAQIKAGQPARDSKFIWVWVNPLRSVKLLKYPNVLAISLNSSFVMLTMYCLIVPLTFTLGPRFGITNDAILGCLYLSIGLGNLVGSRIAGHLSDRAVQVWKDLRGERIPEDRLRASVISGGVILPLSLMAAGVAMQLWTTPVGLVFTLIFLVIAGIGLMGVLAIQNTYLVDCLQKRSVEAIAISNCLRYLFSAAASAGVLPLIQAVGVASTNIIAALIAWLGFVLVVATIRWGRSWRERIDGPSQAPPPPPPVQPPEYVEMDSKDRK